MNIGVNCTINEQCRLVEEIVRKNPDVFHVITTMNRFKLNNAYIVAGAITQTIWNYISGYEINYGISDIDIIYFDPANLSYEAEASVIARISEFYSDINCGFDIKNEARVHLWYHDRFGTHIPPYISSESAINSWMSCTAIGVNYKNENFNIYAPYGLNDLFGMICRPNKSLISKNYYEEKSKKWKSRWDSVTVIGWDA